ncbi:MAG: hypothetical protein AAB250_17670 [Bdellovibrionota bacterium]
MKKLGIAFVAAVICLSAGVVTAKHFWRGVTMAKPQVASRWGQAPFDEQKFKSGNEKSRASMAFSILSNQKKFVGKDRTEIRSELGDFDGFYFSDMFPTYLIESGTTPGQDSWQLVFLLDRDEKVSEVIVHKNCCDK